MRVESLNNPVRINHLEVQELLRASNQHLWVLQKELKREAARGRKLQRLLEENDQGAQSWVLDVPRELLPARKLTARKINWKGLVLEVLELYDMPMTTDLLYQKLVLRYDFVPMDRVYVVRNVSAALHYLEARDEKLFRQKEEGRKGFVYGLKHHFGLDLKLKPYYLGRLRLEEGGAFKEMQSDKMNEAV